MSDFELQQQSKDVQEQHSSTDQKQAKAKTMAPGFTKRARDGYGDSFDDKWSAAQQSSKTTSSRDPYANGLTPPKKLDGKSHTQGGYGQRLSDASGEAALSPNALLAVPVMPFSDTLDAAVSEQAAAKAAFSAEGGTDFRGVRATYSASWCTENIGVLVRYKLEQAAACAAFNAWCPIANAAHMARHEIMEAARLLGYDLKDEKSTAAFIASVETGLSRANQLLDAKVLNGANTSWSHRNDDPAARSVAQPELKGTSAQPQLAALQTAFESAQSAYKGVQIAMLADRARILRSQAAVVSSKISQIDSVINFWASGADWMVSAVGTAQAGISAAAAKTQNLGGQKVDGSASMRRSQEARAKFEVDRSGDTMAKIATADNEVNAHYAIPDRRIKHQRQAQQQQQQDAQQGATAPTQAEGLPTPSIGTIVKFGLGLLFRGDLKELRAKLAVVESQAGGTEQALTMLQSRKAVDDYEQAADDFQTKLKNFSGYDLQQRQQDYLALGNELDRYANEHGPSLRAQGRDDLVVSSGKQQHGTTMAVLAKIDQYKALSELALNMFDYEDFISKARSQNQERGRLRPPPETATRHRDKALKPPPTLPLMPSEEQDVYHQIGGTYLRVLQEDEEWRIRLLRVSAGSGALMKRLTGSASSTKVSGRKF